MRFGIFYEHQLPRPWAPGDERRLLTDALEQVELADRLGIDYLWKVEHHLAEVEVPSQCFFTGTPSAAHAVEAPEGVVDGQDLELGEARRGGPARDRG
jgi:hypothetical protein